MKRTNTFVVVTCLLLLVFFISLVQSCQPDADYSLQDPNRNTAGPDFLDIVFNGTPIMFTEPPDSVRYENFTAAAPHTDRSIVSSAKLMPTGGMNNFYFIFDHNNVPGVYPIYNVMFYSGVPPFGLYMLAQASPTVNITYIDPFPSGIIEGNFNVTISNGTPRNFSCNFRVTRD